MLRSLLRVYGVCVTLAPKRVIDCWESLAFETTEEAQRRSWIIPLARLEGLVFLIASVREGDRSRLTTVLGLVGLPALLAPRRYLDWGLKIAYRNADGISVKSWVLPLTRLLGAVYVYVGVRERYREKTATATADG